MRTIQTLRQVENAMNELVSLESEASEITAGANRQISEIRDGVTPRLVQIEEKITRLRNGVEAWAEDNRDDQELFPAGRKTLDLLAGSISFRIAAPSVTLRKGFRTDDVRDRADSLGLASLFKQAEPSLDKAAVKRLYEQNEIDDAMLKKLGLEITQTESILIDLKRVENYA